MDFVYLLPEHNVQVTFQNQSKLLSNAAVQKKL